MEYYSDMRQDEIWHFATTWIESKSVIFNELNKKE